MEKYLDNLDKYFSGQMTEEETAAFEQEMRSDPDLRTAAELYRLSREAIELDIAADLRQSFAQWEKEQDSELPRASTHQSKKAPPHSAKVVPFRRRLYALAAAAVILLLGGFLIWNLAGDQYSNTGLAKSHYQAPEINNLRGNDQAEPDSYFRALELWEKGDLPAAVKELEQVPAGHSGYLNAQYLLGHAAFQQANYTAAIPYFERVRAEGFRLREEAEWNLIQAYLAANRTGSDFQNLLQQLAADPEHSFHSEALQLQDQLNSFWRRFGE